MDMYEKIIITITGLVMGAMLFILSASTFAFIDNISLQQAVDEYAIGSIYVGICGTIGCLCILLQDEIKKEWNKL
ncbi:poxvirus virion envelope protein A14 [Caudoviricetes sp.]|nr:poxvirus virion envelope protein A14 [Caudoviricetes sp.]